MRWHAGEQTRMAALIGCMKGEGSQSKLAAEDDTETTRIPNRQARMQPARPSDSATLAWARGAPLE